MKKITKVLGVLAAAGVFSLTLASCSNVTQSYADKINNEAKDDDGKYITYADAKKALGDECIDITVTALGKTSGILVAVKGIKSQEDLEAKLKEAEEKGTEVKGIVITVLANNCTAAVYKALSTSDLKA